MKISELSEIASKFRGVNHPDNNPTDLLNLEDIKDSELRGILVKLDRNLAERNPRGFSRASSVEVYFGIFTEYFDKKPKTVRELYTQFRKDGNITPEIRNIGRYNIPVYKREHFLAIGALIWADGKKSEKEHDIVAIAHKALGENSIKNFIHKSKPISPDGNGYHREPARQQIEDNIQEKKPAEQQKMSKTFEKLTDPEDVAHYTREELIERFGQTLNSIDNVCVSTDYNLPEGVDVSGRQVIMYSNLYRALMEIAAYHNNTSYNPRQIEVLADYLTSHGVRGLLIMCLDDLRLGYKNVGEILEAVRKANGV